MTETAENQIIKAAGSQEFFKWVAERFGFPALITVALLIFMFLEFRRVEEKVDTLNNIVIQNSTKLESIERTINGKGGN